MTASTNTENATNALTTIAQAKQLGLVGENTLSIPMPFESKIILFDSLRVAGTSHTPGIDTTMDLITEEAPLNFVREPNNPADPWAIRVEHDHKRIGYVPADKNEILARLMDGGKTIQGTFISSELNGNWWKVYMEVYLID